MAEPVEVYIARDVSQAHLLVALLAGDGIEAFVINENLGIALGDLPLGTPTQPRLLVAAEDAERARALILETAEHGNREEVADPEEGPAASD